MAPKILVRVQSPNGTKRIEAGTHEKTNLFFEKVIEAFNLPVTVNFALYKQRDKTQEVNSSRSRSLNSYGIRHGDMLYLYMLNGTVSSSSNETSRTSRSSISSIHPVEEDEVDVFLQKQDGKIQRPRDDRLCQHNLKAKCVHCAPLEPYDERYLREQNIKYMSFHAYLRKLTGGVDKGKFAALENISCKIKSGCQDHLPWPKGICSKCQPNAVTLNRQVYRHVDNVMFENKEIVEQFINYWRTTGHQRIGFLYGRYEPYKDVPLGLKATVACIYEPPQESTRDMVKLLSDDRSELVDSIAKQLGLQKVGWIFTDLISDDIKKGTVKHFRNINSHFLSAQECIMAGHFQNQHANPCHLSPDGFFGSKYVTVCVTGDAQNQVHMEGYQVSNQCMALVRDDCLVPTKDAPELGYIRESSNEQYVPDVFYKEKDNYGNEVIQLARPLPIEYLVVDMLVSTPMEPQYSFFFNTEIKPFTVENRFIDGQIQDFSALALYMQQFSGDTFLNAASDFHFLNYIATMDTLPLKDYMSPLLESVKTKNAELAREWSQSEQWRTVEQLMAAQSPASTSAQSSPFLDSALWTCRHCTYLNQPERNICDICSLPR